MTPGEAIAFYYHEEDKRQIKFQLLNDKSLYHPKWSVSAEHINGFDSYVSLICKHGCGDCPKCYNDASNSHDMEKQSFEDCMKQHVQTNFPDEEWERVLSDARTWARGEQNGFEKSWSSTMKTFFELYWFRKKLIAWRGYK